MNTIQLRRAERKRAKLRIGVSGPSGSGKTYSSLLLANGLTSDWSKVCIIDTENGSGELYSDLGDYNVITLKAPFTPESYIEAIKAAEDAAMEVIILDSVSHEWDGKGGCLEINERLASAKFKGNTWAAWSETTPRHQKFLEAIVTSSCHVITTARAKTDMMQTEDKKVKKVGMKEIQREGFEYELTVNFTIDREHHLAMASKDRTGLFIERDPFLIDASIGQELLKWNEGGAVDIDDLKRQLVAQTKRLDLELPPEKHEVRAFLVAVIPKLTGLDLSDENLPHIIEGLKSLTPELVKATLQKPPEPPQDAIAPVDEPTALQTSQEAQGAAVVPVDDPKLNIPQGAAS